MKNDIYMKRLTALALAAALSAPAIAHDKSIPPNEQRVPLQEQHNDSGGRNLAAPLILIAAGVTLAIVISRNKHGEPQKQAVIGIDPQTGVPGARFEAKF